MKRLKLYPSAAWALAGAASLLVPLARAETGPYIGVGLGVSNLQADAPLVELDDVSLAALDGNEFAWKVFGGFNFDVPFVDVGVEVGYVDLGEYDETVLEESVSLSAEAFTAYGVAAVDPGPFSVFGKIGVVNWDADISSVSLNRENDGTDLALGAGAAFGIGPAQVRGEFEYFNVEDLEDTWLFSVSAIWRF